MIIEKKTVAALGFSPFDGTTSWHPPHVRAGRDPAYMIGFTRVAIRVGRAAARVLGRTSPLPAPEGRHSPSSGDHQHCFRFALFSSAPSRARWPYSWTAFPKQQSKVLANHEPWPEALVIVFPTIYRVLRRRRIYDRFSIRAPLWQPFWFRNCKIQSRFRTQLVWLSWNWNSHLSWKIQELVLYM
jgi:hypothetical protein